jgi:hypothetical protein
MKNAIDMQLKNAIYILIFVIINPTMYIMNLGRSNVKMRFML